MELAWRGVVSVADVFLGSVWNIAWAGTALGAITGAISGWSAAVIREKQEQRHLHMLENGERVVPRAPSENVKDGPL